ncbi:MAG: SAM-dependent methyltransferase [Myxococcaceae bacterium]|nr:SAM-dependent methyltransferase [Myxococcaceae bacterium]
MIAASLDAHLSLLGALGDATRLRLCALLSAFELSVVELTTVMELGQSKVSTHLARLKEQGLVLDRKVSTSSYYRLNESGMAPAARRVWEALLSTLDDATVGSDKRRAEQVLEARDKASWPERVAGELERHYSPGRTWESLARGFAGLVRAAEVLDIGAGDGTVAELLAPRCERYVCFDVSKKLLSAAALRLHQGRGASGVSLVQGDMHVLPFADERFGLVLLFNVLAYARQPERALDEAARVVAPGGELVLVTLHKHESMDIAAQYGHLQPGFTPRWLKSRLASRGLSVSHCEVSSRERARPHFEVVTCFAQKVRVSA